MAVCMGDFLTWTNSTQGNPAGYCFFELSNSARIQEQALWDWGCACFIHMSFAIIAIVFATQKLRFESEWLIDWLVEQENLWRRYMIRQLSSRQPLTRFLNIIMRKKYFICWNTVAKSKTNIRTKIVFGQASRDLVNDSRNCASCWADGRCSLHGQQTYCATAKNLMKKERKEGSESKPWSLIQLLGTWF